MRCYPSDVWTSPAWHFHGLTQAPVHTVVFVSACSRGAGEAIGAGLFVDGGAAQDAHAPLLHAAMCMPLFPLPRCPLTIDSQCARAGKKFPEKAGKVGNLGKIDMDLLF
jgi:hypothetical protein